jgi:alpha-glucosidase
MPGGPLTLRVFVPKPGAPCSGEIYQDDGATYNFQHGAYLRQSFTCSIASNGALSVDLAKPEGSFTPWWKEVRIEVIGFAANSASTEGHAMVPERTSLGSAVTIGNTGSAAHIAFQ